MSAENAIKGIQRAARKREEAAELRKGAIEELRSYCQQAQREGVSITRIASEAHLSRQGVYDLLTERPSA